MAGPGIVGPGMAGPGMVGVGVAGPGMAYLIHGESTFLNVYIPYFLSWEKVLSFTL